MAADAFLYTMISVVVVSLVSFIGLWMLSLKQNVLEKMLLFLVSFAVGALLGDAFLHLLPKALHEGAEPVEFGAYALAGTIIFFLIEKFLRWHHRHIFNNIDDTAHHEHHHAYIKPYVWMNLVGDGIHNFIDGMVIGGSYLISMPLGITTTLAVVIHEGAQEMGDFAVLMKGGLSRSKALFYNFLSSITAIIGGILTFVIGTRTENVASFLIPFTFAGFIYIATATLIPELHHEDTPEKLRAQVVGILLGVAIMTLLLILD